MLPKPNKTALHRRFPVALLKTQAALTKSSPSRGWPSAGCLFPTVGADCVWRCTAGPQAGMTFVTHLPHGTRAGSQPSRSLGHVSPFRFPQSPGSRKSSV